MTTQTVDRNLEKLELESRPNPPPPIDTGTMFQTIDELAVRHGTARSLKERVGYAAGALALCGVVYGLLYFAVQ
jgi:hypothetical protein